MLTIAQLGLGSSGRAGPSNIVVDPNLEAAFSKEGACSNRERRWYFYGAQVPAAEKVGNPFGSPTKLDLPRRELGSPSAGRGRGGGGPVA